MEMINRELSGILGNQVKTGDKVLVLHGARRVGKTTLITRLLKDATGRVEILNGDFEEDRVLLTPVRSDLRRLLGGVDYLFIDEAQNVPQIGRVLKLINDHFPRVRVVATGSSSFEISKRTGEPLTGRQRVHVLYPLSIQELNPNVRDLRTVLEHGLVYGFYPETYLTDSAEEKEGLLKQMTNDYLLKDILQLTTVHRDRLYDILRLVAFQIGSELSFNEIARTVHLDVKTVSRYLSLLEECYVLFRLRGFSRNLRKEIGKFHKFYFHDLGVRNALIRNFNPINLRNDHGSLWKNLLISEKIKNDSYSGRLADLYFWRTYDQQEIDLVEERGGRIAAYEFKWNVRSRRKIPEAWRKAYPDSDFHTVTPRDVQDFLGLRRGTGEALS